MRTNSLMFLFVTYLAGCAVPACAAQWPDIQYPESAWVTPISEQMRMNGLPVRLYAFATDQPLSEVLKHYRSTLGPKKFEPLTQNGSVITAMQGEVLTTVQLKAKGSGTSGFVMQTKVDAQSVAQKRVGLEMPADSKLLSQVESADYGRVSQISVLKNAHSLSANANFYVDLFVQKGFAVVNQQEKTESGKIISKQVWLNNSKDEIFLNVQSLGDVRLTTINLVSRALQ